METIIKVHLKPGKDKMPRLFHPWIFSGALEPNDKSALEKLNQPKVSDQGILAELLDSKNTFVAWGIINPKSQILIRLISWNPTQPDMTVLFTELFQKAIKLRNDMGLLGQTPTGVCRIVFSESDGLPGIIVDRLGDYLIVQLETAGAEMFRRILLHSLITTVKTELPWVKGILERSDGDGRSLEGLPKVEGLVWGQSPPETMQFLENNVHFFANPLGQKTGFYADQRDNRKIVAQYTIGREVTDVCSYSGGFSLYAGKAGAKSLHLVDNSKEALTLAQRNIEVNGLTARYTQSDAFDFLRSIEAGTLDAIVFDPPKLVPSRKTLERGMRAYKDGNLHAIRALKTGGILATFSCSGLVSPKDFEEVFSYAAKDSGRRVQILHWLHQAPCHPVLTSFPEAHYLKGLIARVIS